MFLFYIHKLACNCCNATFCKSLIFYNLYVVVVMVVAAVVVVVVVVVAVGAAAVQLTMLGTVGFFTSKNCFFALFLQWYILTHYVY